jgi:glycosyltransferase involved in cell wall biosynthesis
MPNLKSTGFNTHFPKMPTVSVIIPVWNGEATIAQAIDSALAQRYDGEIEVIVINDGSTDSTRTLLLRYTQEIKVVEQARRGRAAARNAGVAVCCGEYLAFLDADDIWIPGKLAKSVPILQNRKDCVLVYSNAQWVDARGSIIGTYLPAEMTHAPSLDEILSRTWMIPMPSVVMRKSTFDACGGFPEEFALSYPGEDNYLWILARELGNFVFLPEQLALCGHTPPLRGLDKHGGAVWTGDKEAYIRSLEERIHGYAVLAALVRKRFGRRASGLLHELERSQMSVLVGTGLAALTHGDTVAARNAYRFALRRSPFQPKVVFRLLWTYLPATVTRKVVHAMPSRLCRNLVGSPPNTTR